MRDAEIVKSSQGTTKVRVNTLLELPLAGGLLGLPCSVAFTASLRGGFVHQIDLMS